MIVWVLLIFLIETDGLNKTTKVDFYLYKHAESCLVAKEKLETSLEKNKYSFIHIDCKKREIK